VRRAIALFKRSLIFVHRWIGVGLALLFMLWFTSGIVMMYWSYPQVSERDRLAHAAVLRPADIRVTPAEAYAGLGREEPPAQVLLTTFDDRPVYRFDGGSPNDGDEPSMVYADDGTVQRVVTPRLVDRAASQWARRSTAGAVNTTVPAVDQWTLGLRVQWPLQKFSWPDGQQVYVDGETAKVVQSTTSSSRFWSWLGAIPHWLYFTPLRRNPRRWTDVVVWSSAIGTCAALSGLALGLWMLSPRKRYRHAGSATSIPYRGWKRWHTIVGLCFGLIALTWVFSGMLSMGPFEVVETLVERTLAADPAERSGKAPDRVAAVESEFSATAPLVLSSFAARPPAAAIAAVPDFAVKELALGLFDGKPVYLATNGAGDTRVIPVQGPPMMSHDRAALIRRVRRAAGSGLQDVYVTNEYDAYYLDRRRERPLPVVVAVLNDRAKTRFYIDPRTASIVGSYSVRGWVDRWLYHGLHSLDFPWLYHHRPLWDIVVLTLLVGGNALCATSLVLAWRVLSRNMKGLWRGRRIGATEDLVIDADAR